MNGLGFLKTICLRLVPVAAILLLSPAAPAQTQEIQNDVSEQLLLARLVNAADEILGATIQPVGDSLRAQLEIPAGQGLLVASVLADGPSAQAGLKANDILLTLADKPLASTEELTRQLKAAGDSAVPLKLLRAGKPMTIQVRPIYRVTLGPVEEKKTEYFIGVSIEAVDDPLRAQLGLAAGRGVLVTEVVAGSPAEKAGIKKYDIVLDMGDKPIDSPDTLTKLVQASQDKPTTMKLLHAGKEVAISLAPAVRKVEANVQREAVRFLTRAVQLNEANLDLDGHVKSVIALRESQEPRVHLTTRAGIEDIRQRMATVEHDVKGLQRIESIEKELKSLRESVERINDTIKAGKPKRD
jgi:membrane-associated protease RseP (regulator of RpoE activity)